MQNIYTNRITWRRGFSFQQHKVLHRLCSVCSIWSRIAISSSECSRRPLDHVSEAYEKGVHPAFARLAAVCLRQGLAHKYCSISANKLVEDLQALFDTRVMCYMTSAFWKWCVKQRSGQAIFNLGNLHDDQGDFTKAQTFWEDAAQTAKHLSYNILAMTMPTSISRRIYKSSLQKSFL